MTATDWRLAEEHAQRCFDEERWGRLLRNTQQLRDKHVRAAEEARRKRLAAAAPATSGEGWRVTDPPGSCTHEELERLARKVVDVAFHGMVPWPNGWRVRFGEVDPNVANAATVMSAKVIIVDRRRVAGRALRPLLKTVVHELKHVLDPDASHGHEFDEAVDRAVDYITDGLESAPTMTRPTRLDAAARIAATKGRRFGPFGFLDPDTEYR